MPGRPPDPVGAFPTFAEGFNDGFGQPAEGRQRGRFYRQDGNLLLVPLGRGATIGQGGDAVSEVFVYEGAVNTPAFTASEAHNQVADAWADNKAAAAATLKAAVDQALHDAGYRSPLGGDLI